MPKDQSSGLTAHIPTALVVGGSYMAANAIAHGSDARARARLRKEIAEIKARMAPVQERIDGAMAKAKPPKQVIEAARQEKTKMFDELNAYRLQLGRHIPGRIAPRDLVAGKYDTADSEE